MSCFAVAGIQMNLSAGDNLSAMAEEVARVKQRFPWVQMLVFGELCAFGARPEAAQPLPGPAEEWFCTLARKHELWLIPGSLYEIHAQHIYNTAPVIDPRGVVIGRYRKMYPFLPYEKDIAAGDQCLVFDVPGVGRFGVSICYDMWFAETTRSMVCMGAEVILHPTLTNTMDRDVELAIARASAVTNQCYFLDVNSAGDLAYGRSIIVGPEGDVIHVAGSGHEVMPLQLDLERVRRTRRDGVHGLGQPLKSFRDAGHSFPAYSTALGLHALGPLEMPAIPSTHEHTQASERASALSESEQ